MKIKTLIIICCSWLMLSCNSEPTLQKYFVQHTEDANFISLDISPSVLKIKPDQLTDAEKKAFDSFNKMNILAFQLDSVNATKYETEKTNVEKILKDEQYQSLIKFGSGKEGISVSYIGTEEKIDEIILFAKNDKTGFAVARILGNKMTPTDMIQFVGILQKTDFDLDQLKPLKDMVSKK
ncbi:DUF4252 domain-containing protein [Flavobacterium sp.]|uniref:DUF4252 domain-containing protein n=1 Tax=Flavobacterium sp. TaxID=239 RepID=UPI00260FFA65|nr:DUF4252 domain-containing protein [Flavobacterium sp.]MDD3003897.1 DUF4252 domain-containing protein [Flavobacterium sp.]